jgi:hypothetical protein
VLDKAYRIGASLAIKQAEEEDSNIARNSAMLAAGAYPFLVGLANNRASLKNAPVTTDDFKALEAALKPGDILVSGDVEPSSLKAQIASVTGDADFQHVATHLGKTPRGNVQADIARDTMFGVSPGEAGLTRNRNIRVLRFKNPAELEALNKHLGNIAGENISYSTSRGIKAGIKDLLVPDFLRKRSGGQLGQKDLADKLRCHGGTCSNVVGAGMADRFKGKDILRSDAFETVMDYTPTDTARVTAIYENLKKTTKGLSDSELIEMANKQLAKNKAVNKVLKNSKTIAKAGLGAAGAGLIYGASRIPDSDLSAGEAALGLGAAGLGALPFMNEGISRWARETHVANQNKDLFNRMNKLLSKGMTEEQAVKVLKQEALDAAQKYINENRTGLSLKDIEITADKGHDFYQGKATPEFILGKDFRKVRSTIDKNILLHELGHAEDFVNGNPRATRKGIMEALGVLRDETVANRNAFRHLAKTEGLGSALRLAKSNVVPYSTYASDVLKHLKVPGAVLGTAGLGGLAWQLAKDDESKKEKSILDMLGIGE